MTNFRTMCKYIIMALLAFGVIGCNSITNTKPEQTPTVSKRSKTYLALGDSYTIGTAVAFPDNFPNQLVDSIFSVDSTEVSVKIVAQNGWRTDDLQRGINSADLDSVYDLVSLLIGVNNQYQGLPLEDFEQDLRLLLDTAVKYAGYDKRHVFVISIPNYGFTPFGADKKEETTADLEKFNGLSRFMCEEYGINFYNITDISLEAETNASYRANDDLHPSATQYAAWVSSFLDRVVVKLE